MEQKKEIVRTLGEKEESKKICSHIPIGCSNNNLKVEQMITTHVRINVRVNAWLYLVGFKD
jgi:hypothetical protein